MNTQKSMGFTIAELLVTIAIMAVLAAMVVPVFEARSEEARTLTCQSNMQRIVTAIRMYMADHDDTMPPDEHRPEVQSYFRAAPGGGHTAYGEDERCWADFQSNPYLRWPVILDSYVPDRTTWQCPSATITTGAGWIIPNPDWFSYVQSNEGRWGSADITGGGPCHYAWPKGWGGEVTDSIEQRRFAVPFHTPLYHSASPGAFVQSIGTIWWPELRLAEVEDTSRFVVAHDSSFMPEGSSVALVAYPEICALMCANEICGWADWEECDFAADCGLYRNAPRDSSFLRNVSLRTPYARHRARLSGLVPMWQRSGVNVGFLDGHVQWLASEAVLEGLKAGALTGVMDWERQPNSQCGFAELYPGVPTLY